MKILAYPVALILLAGPLVASEPVWSEQFEEGIGGVQPYHRQDPRTLLQLSDENPAQGSHSLRMDLPGKRALEGFELTAGTPPHRLLSVRAMVRGSGNLLLALMSQTGWAYATPIALDHQWREVTLSKTTGMNDRSLRICFLAPETQPGAWIEVDDVRVDAQPPLDLSDTEVEPLVYAATRHGKGKGNAQEEEGMPVWSAEKRLLLGELPFPQTSLPISLYVRLKSEWDEAQLHVRSRRGGGSSIIRSASGGPGGDWQWVEIPGLTAEEIGKTLELEITADAGELLVERLALSTREGVESESLETTSFYGNW